MQVDVLNFVPPPYRIEIGNAGNSFDLAPFVESFTLRRPRAEIGTPYSWQGSMTLSVPLDARLLPESFDDLVNPGRWARGVHPIRFYFNNILFCTVRILEYFYKEDDFKAEVELGDLLVLLNFKTPAKDYKGMGFTACKPLPSPQVVQKLLQEAGINSAAISVSGLIDVPPDKPSGSFIQIAQQYLGERGYWLYVDPHEVVRSASYSISPSGTIFRKARTEVEQFERQRSPDVPAEKLLITGSIEKYVDCDEKSTRQVEEEFDDQNGFLVNRKITTTILDTPSKTARRSFVIQARGIVFPEKYPDSYSMATTEITTETKSYDSQGRLTRYESHSSKPLAISLPQQFPERTELPGQIEAIVETYSENLPDRSTTGIKKDGVIRCKTRTVYAPFPIGVMEADREGTNIYQFGPGYSVEIKEKVVETWEEGGSDTSKISIGSKDLEGDCTCQRYTYKKRVYQRTSIVVSAQDKGFRDDVPFWTIGGLLIKNNYNNQNEDATPPAWETREAICPTCTATVKSEVKLSPTFYSPYHQTEFEYSASTLQSNTEAQRLGSIIGSLQQQRYKSRSISMPLPIEYLRNPTPFSRIDVHNGAFICDSPSLVFGEDGLEVSFIGNFIGTIPAVEEQTRTLVINFSSVVLETQSFITNQFLSINISILGGTPPLTFSSRNLPDGLTIADRIISGVPLTPTTTAIVVGVRDADNRTITVTIPVVIEGLPSPIPTFQEIIRHEVEQQNDSNYSLVDVLPFEVFAHTVEAKKFVSIEASLDYFLEVGSKLEHSTKFVHVLKTTQEDLLYAQIDLAHSIYENYESRIGFPGIEWELMTEEEWDGISEEDWENLVTLS